MVSNLFHIYYFCLDGEKQATIPYFAMLSYTITHQKATKISVNFSGGKERKSAVIDKK